MVVGTVCGGCEVLYHSPPLQESHSEELLVSRMLRQCQQEQRIATQLMQVRKEKDNIRNNRIQLQRQFEERRQKDFEEYLKRQAVSGQHCIHIPTYAYT